MRFEGVGKSHLIMRLVQVVICLFMVHVFHNIGQIDTLEQYKDKAFYEKNPGKAVLLLSLNKQEYKVGEPIIFQDVLLNDGETDIIFPVQIGYYNFGEEILLQSYFLLTNEKGESLPSELGPLLPYYIPLSTGVLTLKPHNAVPCFDCSHDLLGYVDSWNFRAEPVTFKSALQTIGTYYLQTIYTTRGSGDTVILLDDNRITRGSPIPQNLWKGVVLSNKVKFEIKQ